jgi:histidinol-phosphate aminotransferase
MSQRPGRFVRPLVRDLHAYTPGEQPAIRGLIKLNTNENPYPPAPAVLRAVQSATDARLRLYPNPTSQRLREKLARFHRCRPDQIIVGNGSDELLALATRCFVEPATAVGRTDTRSIVQFFQPSYSLYPVLAAIHGARVNAVPLETDFGIPEVSTLKKVGRWSFGAALTLVTTPNAPSGRGYTTRALAQLCRAQQGVVLLDEAYVDFATEHALSLALKLSNVLVARTFSKAYSLCFQRVGYFVGHVDLIASLDKIRDSYNVNGLGQVAAEATLDHLPYYRRHFARIRASRTRVTRALTSLGFTVLPSETNFVLTKPPGPPARRWLVLLREHGILVRWFSTPDVADYLRITIGTDREVNALVRAARRILDTLS